MTGRAERAQHQREEDEREARRKQGKPEARVTARFGQAELPHQDDRGQAGQEPATGEATGVQDIRVSLSVRSGGLLQESCRSCAPVRALR